jgi:hypothetical protein
MIYFVENEYLFETRISQVIGWKFNRQAGMSTREGVITQFPGGIPSQSLQDAWTIEYEADGLPAEYLKIAKRISNDLLTPTDWYIARKSETSVAIPAKITAYRTAVRTVYAAVKSAIAGASNADALAALYVVTVGASGGGASGGTPLEVDGTDANVVSTSDNTVTSNGHGYVNGERIRYNDGQDSGDKPIKGLVSGEMYYVINSATNTFKLSLTPTVYGDEAVVSLTGVADSGTAHTFTSFGKPSVGVDYPDQINLAYK